MIFRVTVNGYSQGASYLQAWYLGIRISSSICHCCISRGIQLDFTSYFGKWKFSGFGEFLSVNIDNQETILTSSKIMGSSPQPLVSREAVMSINL